MKMTREEAIETLGHVVPFATQNGEKIAEAIDMAIEALSRPKGEWMHDTHYGINFPEHKCSICGEWEYSDEESNFCPNCGADMRGEKNGDK